MSNEKTNTLRKRTAPRNCLKRLVGLRGLVVRRRRDGVRFRILTAELRRDFGYRATAAWVTLRETGARKPVWSHRNNAPLLVRLDDYAF